MFSNLKSNTGDQINVRVEFAKPSLTKLVLTFVFVEFTICLTYLFFNDYILNILFEIIVKIFNPFVLKIYLFIVPYNNDCTI